MTASKVTRTDVLGRELRGSPADQAEQARQAVLERDRDVQTAVAESMEEYSARVAAQPAIDARARHQAATAAVAALGQGFSQPSMPTHAVDGTTLEGSKAERLELAATAVGARQKRVRDAVAAVFHHAIPIKED